MKKCRSCRKLKAANRFHKKRAAKDGLQSVCILCGNKERCAYLAAKKDRVIRRLYVFLKGNQCYDCGESNPLLLQFDHVRGVKSGSVAQMATKGRSWDVIQDEIDKCVIRCAHCHIIKTVRERQRGTVWKIAMEEGYLGPII